MSRPDLERITSAATLRDWYWLKAELEAYCREHGLSRAGTKAELTDRIAAYIETGAKRPSPRRRVVRSGVDWATAKISRTTRITPDITFGPNVRGFFVREIGKKFSCTSEFMAWMKQNPGRPFADAIDYWNALQARKTDPDFKRTIAPGNQYNQYLRDFFEDNPKADMKTARACWAAKRARKGKPVYAKSDLKLI
jgi:hypothetical protein